MSVLMEIVKRRRRSLDLAKGMTSLSELKRRCADAKPPGDFKGALRRDGQRIRLIAEIKKASPSRGLIRKGFDLSRIASIYEEKPVSAISVLTEEDFFQGSLSYIQRTKDLTTKPVLRKDFIFDDYQMYESRAHGADALLLIAAILERSLAEDLLLLSKELGLGVLFEVHDERDLEKALLIGFDIIGINNRDLMTLKVDLSTTLRLRKEIPNGKVIVSESGIRNRDDAKALEDAGIDAMLVGTSLMEASDIGQKIDELMGLTQDVIQV